MTDGEPVGWATCIEDGCVGVQLTRHHRCWAHADPVDLGVHLDQLGAGGHLDGRGVGFTAVLLERLLQAAPHDDAGHVLLSAAHLDRATFTGGARFNDAVLTGEAHFDKATFTGDAWFEGATFLGDATFDEATITGNAWFSRATFTGDASFEEATLAENASFDDVTFTGDASFDGATLGDAWFRWARFTGDASFHGATLTGNAWFSEATFARAGSFVRASFMGQAWFDRATLTGEASFDWATFMNEARFEGTTFTDEAVFHDAAFSSDASFDLAKFKGDADFNAATFTGNARFDQAAFMGGVEFAGAAFGGHAGFHLATFGRDARFRWVTFEREARFGGANFAGDADFLEATVERARQLGPMVVRNRLLLDGALFRERIRIELSAAALSCRRARFLAGVQLRVRWAQVVLDDADLAAPSALTFASEFSGLDEPNWLWTPEEAWPVDRLGTPRLLSVRGADVAGLTVSGVDLRACRFVDAYCLDQLRADASKFANTPPGWRWTKRRAIAEEHQWRSSRGRQGWYAAENQPPVWLEPKKLDPEQPGLLPPGHIARIYRDLRKGLEDSKDEPGAADFYYGEMEMRRHAPRESGRGLGGFLSFWGERSLVTAYWLVSGYGLRASRAFLALAVTIAVGAVLFNTFGFVADPKEGPLLFSLESSISLLRVPEGEVTRWGQVIQIGLRLLGPLFFGLALLALRGRVKR